MALLAHYKLNGDGTDATGHGHDGSPTDVSWVAGKIGQAASFNGTSSKIEVPNPGNLLDGKFLTVCAWVYRNGLADVSYPRIVDRVAGGQFSCYLHNSGSRMGCAIKGASGSVDTTGFLNSILPLYEWTHCAWVYDGATIKTFVGGAHKNTVVAAIGGLAASISLICIGQRANVGAAAYFKGYLDDVRVYDEALPGWKITALHNAGNGTEAAIFGPYDREAAQAAGTGAVAGEVFSTGAAIGQDYRSGADAGQVR